MSDDRPVSPPPPLPIGALPSRPPAPPPLPVEASGDLASNPPARRQLFCRDCGAPWVPDALICLACAPAAAAAATGQRALDGDFDRQRSALKSALRLYFALLAVCIVVIAIVVLREGDLTFAEQLGADLAVAAITLIWAVRWRRQIAPLFRVATAARWWLIALAGAAVTYPIAYFAVTALTTLTGLPEVRYLDAFEPDGIGFVWALVSICVIPAVFEEIAFRGVILEAMGAFLSRGEAVIVSALLFAILHLSVPSIPHLAVMGLILAMLRLWSGSLLPGMLLHFAHNLLVILSERFGSGGLLPW
jgi:membrane protease YdiL (CAAX protease family)